jgi:serine/threonine-protein kinase
MATLETGRLLANRYLLQDRLGDGGHAEVWKARDARDGRQVALKFLHLSSGSGDAALAVLRHEADMVHRLDHPGVLKVGDPGLDGPFVFLPMDFAAGGDASWLRGAPWQRVLPVLLQTARVLEHAHARGVVHRDLKARNVLFDALGNVLLSDFGAAASTGSSDAPAAGSPFSASPQQLRDDPADPADDIYGLGALAYELLTRYPPFYPNFDARRVQLEDPAAPVTVHPAPAEILALVQSMLARDAAARPILATVINEFERHLSGVVEARGEAAEFIVEAVPEATPPVARTRTRWWVLPWVGVGLATAGAVAALVWMPRPPSTPVAASTPEVASMPAQRVADAVLSVDPVVSAASAPTIPESTTEDALHAGRSALVALQPGRARAAFQHALALQPGLAPAQQGIAASERLAAQLAALAEGAKLEARGDLPAAADHYRKMLASDSGFAPALAARDRVQQRLRQQKLDDLIIAGTQALQRGQIAQAASAYRQAAEIDPRDARLRAGQQRLAEVLADQRNADDLATGAQLEQAESWDAAVAHYRTVLARDAHLGFAQDGLARSERRAALDRELRDYLDRPERLTAQSVQAAAERAMARAQATSGDSPRLQQQLGQLRELFGKLSLQVRVAISSDNSTQVTVAPLGDLGSFSRRELQLRPGHYVVIGRRDGFRDVRYELEISPGQYPPALSVQCTERI